jgi:hypothetical protein
MLRKHAVSWITLTPDFALQVHLWRSVVQSGAKMQPVFRSNRNYDTHTSPNLRNAPMLRFSAWQAKESSAVELVLG